MYNINQQIVLSDLPGFGHAKVSFETYDSWLEVVKIYLKRILYVSVSDILLYFNMLIFVLFLKY